jgi:hypothetical protein
LSAADQQSLLLQVVAIAGTAFFSAAATSSGLLHTWRPGGNLLLPPLALGCPAVRLQAQGDYGLLLVGADGELVLLDLQRVSGDQLLGLKLHVSCYGYLW